MKNVVTPGSVERATSRPSPGCSGPELIDVAVEARRRGDVPDDRLGVSGFDDAGDDTVNAATPATFRTNVGLIETSGKEVTVRVTLCNVVSENSRSMSASLPNHDYVLAPNQFLMLHQIAKQVLGDDRDKAFRGDLKNLYVEFQVVEGEGSVVVFTSSIDNGTGDQVLKMD